MADVASVPDFGFVLDDRDFIISTLVKHNGRYLHAANGWCPNLSCRALFIGNKKDIKTDIGSDFRVELLNLKFLSLSDQVLFPSCLDNGERCNSSISAVPSVEVDPGFSLGATISFGRTQAKAWDYRMDAYPTLYTSVSQNELRR